MYIGIVFIIIIVLQFKRIYVNEMVGVVLNELDVNINVDNLKS